MNPQMKIRIESRSNMGALKLHQLVVHLGVNNVAAEAVELQMVAELPAGGQLHVHLVATLHFQHNNLRAHRVTGQEKHLLQFAPSRRHSCADLLPGLRCLHRLLGCFPKHCSPQRRSSSAEPLKVTCYNSCCLSRSTAKISAPWFSYFVVDAHAHLHVRVDCVGEGVHASFGGSEDSWGSRKIMQNDIRLDSATLKGTFKSFVLWF